MKEPYYNGDILKTSKKGKLLRCDTKTLAPLRVQFLLTFFLGGRGEEQEALALLSKKEGGGRCLLESVMMARLI